MVGPVQPSGVEERGGVVGVLVGAAAGPGLPARRPVPRRS